jgi:hypothetical protein
MRSSLPPFSPCAARLFLAIIIPYRGAESKIFFASVKNTEKVQKNRIKIRKNDKKTFAIY